MTDTDKPLVCVIDRAIWARGRKKAWKLVNDNGTMCCLGFLGKACGVSETELKANGSPFYIEPTERAKYPDVDKTQAGDEWMNFIHANDNEEISEASREKRLRALAKKHGFRFSFRGRDT
jgi:hypothetical protein